MPTSRQQRRAKARSPLKKRSRSTWAFIFFLLLLVVGGGVAIAISRLNPPPLTRGASVGEHWHASYEIHICGQRLGNFPTVEGDVHSHGDGFIHIHPTSTFAGGDNANLGAFLQLFDTSITQEADGTRTLTLADGTTFTDGEACESDDTEHTLEVLNHDEVVGGDPSRFIPHDGDAIVIRFGEEGEEIIPNPYNVLRGIPDVPGDGVPISEEPTPVPD